MLVTLLILTSLSLTLSLVFTPLVRILALRCNLVDVPDNKRKVHKKPIPRVGGVALLAAYFGSCLAVAGIFAWLRLAPPEGFAGLNSIAPATLLIFLIGLADDVFGLKPWHKLLVEVLAAVLVVSAGVHIGDLTMFTTYPLLGKAATIVWLIGCTNAVNLIDGLDGLASGVALLATVTILIASLITGHIELTIATAPLAGALLGFLVFNFNPASIFLGDCGSLVLGFLLGCFSVLWTAKSATLFGLTAPLMTLSIPLLDTTLAISRRFLSNQPIFRPDRSHIHHRLLARGLSQRGAVVALYLAAGLAGALSLALIWVRNHSEAVILITFLCAAIYGIQQLGYAEFGAARKVLFRGGLRRGIRTELAVRAFEESLKEAATVEDCWEVIVLASKDLELHPVRMRIAGILFSQGVQNSMSSPVISIGISEDEWIELSLPTTTEQPNTLVPFATAVRSILSEKKMEAAFSRDAATSFSSAIYKNLPLTVQ